MPLPEECRRVVAFCPLCARCLELRIHEKAYLHCTLRRLRCRPSSPLYLSNTDVKSKGEVGWTTMSNWKQRLSVMLFCAACTVLCAAQGRKFPTPPEPADPTIYTQGKSQTQPRPRIDVLELQREARELSDLAHTVPTDIDKVSHGLLPKDLAEKLKRIEKLSKHLRTEVTQ